MFQHFQAEKAKVIQTLLFVSGLTTLFQSFFGTRLPVIAAASYAYIIPITSIISSNRFTDYTDPFEVSLRINIIINFTTYIVLIKTCLIIK